jgi:hypothetical protein
MALIEITKKEREVLADMCYWLQNYIDYFGDEVSADGDETDAQRFGKMLPVLKGLLTKKESKPKVKMVCVEREYKDYNDIIDLIDRNQSLKGYIYTSVRMARESVKPLYKYLVCDSGLLDDCCWVTDDIGRAMEFGMSQVKSRNRMYNVLSIKKCQDGSYKTFIDGVCDTCGYSESGGARDYLHFDYIAQRYGYDNIKKIE